MISTVVYEAEVISLLQEIETQKTKNISTLESDFKKILTQISSFVLKYE